MSRISKIIALSVLIGANLFSHSTADADVKITKSNKGNVLFIGGAESFACYSQRNENSSLGSLSQNRLREGAVFKNLSYAQELQKLERAIVGFNARLSRSKTSSSKNLYRGKIAETKKAIARLNRANGICQALNKDESEDAPKDTDSGSNSNPPTNENNPPSNENNPPSNENNTPSSEPVPPIPTPTPTSGPTPQPTAEPIPPIEQPEQNLTGPVKLKSTAVKGSLENCPSNSIVTVFNEKTLLSTVPTGCQFQFDYVPPGSYKLLVNADGYDFGKPRQVSVVTENLVSASPLLVNSTELPGSEFRYHWESEDASTSGYEYSAYVVQPPQLVFPNNPVTLADGSSVQKLISEFKVYLSNDDQVWDNESAARLYNTLASIPNLGLSDSRWTLSKQEIVNDIDIVSTSDGALVRVAASAFTYAQSRTVELDGVRGELYSKRLFKAAARFVTDNGSNLSAVEKILKDRFDVSIIIPNYSDLTYHTTREGINSFQQFKPEERLYIIQMFEEMPLGMHKTAGLHYLARRKDGFTNPIYPQAAAVAWVDNGYIEFMETTFSGSEFDTRKLLIHEKSHFLWKHLFDQQLRDEWINLGGWYFENGVWTTNQTTGFVTAYSHAINPDEDMAESIAYYVINPNGLISRSPAKYNFIKDRIMKGDRYLSQIRQDLTFQVYNLDPDYIYPGKIKKVDLLVTGSGEEDKGITIEFETHSIDQNKDGASHVYTRIFSPDRKTYFELYLNGVNPNYQGLSTKFRGSYPLSKFSKSGYWLPNDIILTDNQGNSRYQKPSTIGWKLFINNPLEDSTPPAYQPGSLIVTKYNKVVEGHTVNVIKANWNVIEEKGVNRDNSAFAAFVRVPELANSYSLQAYGQIDPQTLVATVEFTLNPYRASGDYGVAEIVMMDKALNTSRFKFYTNPTNGQEGISLVEIQSAASDTAPPTIDPNQIHISAINLHPEAPNGETSVTLSFDGLDDLSGIGMVSFVLLDPQGIRRHNYLYHSNTYTLIFSGDPTAHKVYTANVILPVGSPPGLWGLANLEVSDKAGNMRSLNFVETVHFQVN